MRHFKSTQDLMIAIQELYSHHQRLLDARGSLTGANLARCDWSLQNLRKQILELETLTYRRH